MSENIYDILSKLNGAMGKTSTSIVEVDPIVESINPDDLSGTVSLLEKKFSEFNPGDENEGNWLNPKAKRAVQLAKAKYPETASDLEAVVAAMGDKTEELDQRDRETGEWMDKAKATIDAQQKEIKRTEQAIVAANARYDAQEKRFQDFTQQVAAADLPVQQQAQAAVDFAKATKDSGAAPEKIAARGKEIVAKAKQKAKAKEKEKEQPTAIQNQPAVDMDTDVAGDDDQDTTKSPASSPLAARVQGLLKNQPSTDEIPKITPAPTSTAPKTPRKDYTGAKSIFAPTKKAAGSKQLDEQYNPVAAKNSQALSDWSGQMAEYYEQLQEPPQPGQVPPTPPQQSVKLEFPDGAVNLSKATIDRMITVFTKMRVAQRTAMINSVLSDRGQLNWFLQNMNSPRKITAPQTTQPQLKKGQTPDMFDQPDPTQQKLPAGARDPYLDPQFESKKFLGNPGMKNLEQIAESLLERFMAFKEEAKPDFLDLDKDGDTEEPMKKAAKDAKEHEPAKVDKDAVAKRKRLQALKDKQEDERAEKGDYDDEKSSSRKIKGRAYGGSAQKDDEEKDLDESGLQAYLGKKKYGKEGMKALQKAGREGASKEKMALIRARHDKMDEVQMDEVSYSAKAARAGKDIGKPGKAFAKIAKSAGERYGSKERGEKVAGAVLKKLRANEGEGCMDEVAPPGAKAERMVKHIKKGYAKDGKLSKKEKGIAYATAWKAHNKGQVEEATKFGDTIKNSKAEMKKHKMVKEGRNPESSEYTYETVGRILSDEQPGLDCNSEAFVKAVYDELIEMKMTPKAARWLVHYDEDFISDTASAYSHFCDSKAKEAMECGAPINSFVSEEPLLDAEQELAEIARLAGLTREATICETCDCDPCTCDEGLEPMAPMDSASPLTHTEEGMGCSEEELNEAATRKDFRMVADLLKSIPDIAKRTELALYHADIFKEQNPRFKKEMFLAAAGVDTTPIKDESIETEGNAFTGKLAATPKGSEFELDGKKFKDTSELEEDTATEGNEFSGALAKAKAAGEKEFEVDGKKYTVKEDINLNVSATGEEDVVNLIRKLSGMPVVAIQAQPAVAEEALEEEGPKERDIEYTNTPREEVAGTDAAIPAGADLNRAKKQYKKEYPGDNPMAVAEAKEESLWRAYESMINDLKA